jgi:hypothetical protein
MTASKTFIIGVIDIAETLEVRCSRLATRPTKLRLVRAARWSNRGARGTLPTRSSPLLRSTVPERIIMGATLAPALARRPKTKRGLAAALDDLIRTLSDRLFDTYRPELHYMRGPGPKWHAKHGVQIGAGTSWRHTRQDRNPPVGTAVAAS